MVPIGPAAALMAQSAYGNTSAQSTVKLPDVNADNAASFHKLVNQNFNKFASMSPQEIMALVKSTTAPTNNVSTMAASMVGTIANKVRTDEQVKKRSIIGEASLAEVIAATSEAKVTLQTAVALRNKLTEAWNQIMNMPV